VKGREMRVRRRGWEEGKWGKGCDEEGSEVRKGGGTDRRGGDRGKRERGVMREGGRGRR